ncbi:MAG TPA: hypothetical protein PLR28_09890 [Dokdonella sp.]|uniref:hypothetical protein n=1 Tax=Dokdonella sp. TaxID=2291710 RepID=UPI002C386504|nr:hypothetical protein [Dokdonella sp.]HOX72139.1 hypothetical protein [Dokdonella sp.]HPG94852.1 hypothetical protein [Dokdonella sp.]HPN80571.1 hypothetical protein [Dokdonella sp.]
MLGIAAAAPLQAATFTVTSTSPTGTGSLSEAILALNVASGNSHAIEISFNGLPATINLNGPLPQLDKPLVAVRSTGLVKPTISGGTLYRIFDLGPNVTLFTLSDVQLTRGVNFDGGCLHAPTAGIVVARVSFNACTAQREGGAIHAGGSLSIDEGIFTNNVVRSSDGGISAGGAISKTGTGNLVVEDTLFEGNAAWVEGDGGSTFGGAIALNTSGNANRCTRCRFVENASRRIAGAEVPGAVLPSTYMGGAVFIQLGTMRLESSTLRRSYAQTVGSGIATIAPSGLTILNTTLSGNYAFGGGGGLFDSGNGAEIRIINSVFDSNGARGGVPFDAALSAAHLLLDSNSLIDVFNSAFGSTQVPGFVVAAPRHCSVANGGTVSVGASNNVRVPGDEVCGLGATTREALHLGPWVSGASGVERRSLFASSPLLDAGSVLPVATTGSACHPSDMDGTSRPQDSNQDGIFRCSIGPYETSTERSLFAEGFELDPL